MNMKKLYSILKSSAVLWVAAIALLCTAVSCSTDDIDDNLPQPTYPETGTTFVKVRPWGRSVSIPVPNIPDDAVAKLQFVSQYFDWELQVDPETEREVIVLTLKAGVPKKSFLDKIPILYQSSHGPAMHTLYVVAQPDEAEIPEAEVPRYERHVGMSINVTHPLGSNPIENILNFDLLKDENELTYISSPRSWARKKSGMDYKEMKHNMFEQMGISFLAENPSGIGDALFGADTESCFGGSFNQTFSKNTVTTNKFEYEAAYYDKAIMEMHINTSLYTTDNAEDFLRFLLDDAAFLLNCEGSDLYKRYDNTKEGIYRLYDTYGTHVLVGGVFGGSFTYLYSRKANSYFEEMDVSVQIDLQNKEVNTGGSNWMQSYLNTLGACGISLGVGGGETESEYTEHTEAEGVFYITGGNASADYDRWDSSITGDNDNLAIVSYSSRGNAANGYLIPLYRLTTNPARHDALKEYLDDYIEERKEEVASPKLVVADFLMQTVDNGHSIDVTYKKMQDPDRQERVYFPLVANLYVPGSDGGFMLDTSSDDFLVVSDTKDQLWWVALDFADECKPLTHICFLSEDENDDLSSSERYVLRGEHADTGMDWPQIDNNYVGIRRAERGTTEGVITGVALSRKSNKGKYYVIASSPGTDMLQPYDEYASQAQFRKYWGDSECYEDPTPYYHIGLRDADAKSWEKVDSWFGNCGSPTNAGNWIMPAYTTEEIEFPLVNNKEYKNFERPAEY